MNMETPASVRADTPKFTDEEQLGKTTARVRR
jgi:hypothetical protein